MMMGVNYSSPFFYAYGFVNNTQAYSTTMSQKTTIVITQNCRSIFLAVGLPM